MPTTADLQQLLQKVQDHMTPEERRTVAAALAWSPSPYEQAIARCKADPVAWISSSCISYDPRLKEPYGRFVLYPRQVEYVRWLEDREKTQTAGLVEKSRDTGATTILVSYFLWRWLFFPGFAGGLGSRKAEYVDQLGDPKSLFEKMRMILRGIEKEAPWQMPRGFQWRKHSTEAKLINPQNGSTIVGENGDGIGRGGRYSMYGVDEAAFIEHPDKMNGALAAATNVRIDTSTPNGLDQFYRRRQSGLVSVFRLAWIDDPRKNAWEERDRDGKIVKVGTGKHPMYSLPTATTRPTPVVGNTVVYPWYEKERTRPDYADPSVLAQEVDIDYIGTGRPRFNRAWLIAQREMVYPNNEYADGWKPLRIEVPGTSSWTGTVTTFKDPEYKQAYAILADTARGLTENGQADYSVAHVVNLTTCEQVCHYRGQMSEVEFAVDLAALGQMYNNALMVVETPGPGEAVLVWLANQVRYTNLYSYWDEDAWSGAHSRYGLPMTGTTKPEGDARLASMLVDAEQGIRGAVLIRHPNTFEECVNYVRLNRQSCGADGGGHDDEVACLRLLAMVWAQYNTRANKAISELQPSMPKTANAATTRAVPKVAVRSGGSLRTFRY